jgi:hypothetical protein
MKRPLVVGGKLPAEALQWLERVEQHFPGTCDSSIVTIRNPFSSHRAEEKKVTSKRRARRR